MYKIQLCIIDDNEEVTLFGDVVKEDNRFSYSYGSIDGVAGTVTPAVWEIEWNRSLYTVEQNQRIDRYVSEHYRELERRIIEQSFRCNK